MRSFVYSGDSGSPGNRSCRAGTHGHQREQHSPRAHAGKNALICCCSAGYFMKQLESSAHASNPLPTKLCQTHSIGSCARPQKRRRKFVPERDPVLMVLLGDSYSFFPSDWSSHEVFHPPPPRHCACVRPTMEESEPERKVGMRLGSREGDWAGGGAAG